jgi:hypothetical protein
MPPGRERSEAKKRASTVTAPTLCAVRKRDRLCIRASAEELARWNRAAAASGAPSLSAFVRGRLDAQPIEVANPAPTSVAQPL